MMAAMMRLLLIGAAMCLLVGGVASSMVVGDPADAAAAATNRVPFQIAVVHRHGSRGTIVNVNQSHVCPPVGCGVLNVEGKDMLLHLGAYLREHYAETLSPMDAYDPTRFVSRSTDVGRTLQSAVAMVRGMFAPLEGTPDRAYPVVHTRAIDEAIKLLVWNGNPSVVLWMDVVAAPFVALMDNITLSIFDPEILGVLGDEVGLGEECNASLPTWAPFNCGLDLQDAVNCALSSGTADRFPLAVQQFSNLTKVLSAFNAYSMWGYDDLENGGRYQAATGTLGYALAQDIIASAQAAAVDGVVALRHYSGHDTTLMPLWMTLGNYSLTNPLFAEAMVFEFYYKNTSSSSRGGNSSSSHHNDSEGLGSGATAVVWVAAKIGAPGQLPANHNYTFSPYQLYCMGADGADYTADLSDGCPLSDFQRFVASRGPSVNDASCFFDPEWMPSIDCDPTNPKYATNRVCTQFRTQCLSGCGVGYAMRDDLSCVPTTTAG